MKSITKLTIFGAFILNMCFKIEAQSQSLELNASYIGEVTRNFHGGKKTGTEYLGLANFKVTLNTEQAKLWKGGIFFLNGGNSHGGQPSSDLVGDFQGISNIEAGNHTFLYEFWYKHKLNNFEITLGQQDLNVDFVATEGGTLFSNSSFGVYSNLADNVTSPIFPLTALGISSKWKIDQSIECRIAFFDGTPGDFENNPYNTDWKLSRKDGFLAINEWIWNKSLLRGMNGLYKVGIYKHIQEKNRNEGLYIIADQQIWKRKESLLSLFSQIGFSPNKNKNNFYASIGATYKAPFSKRPDDVCGVALAYAGIHNNENLGSELCIEATYKLKVSEQFYFKPDVQYIVNPVGTEKKLPNALVGMLRFGIEL